MIIQNSVMIKRRNTVVKAEDMGLPVSVVEATLVTYRSIGIGMFGTIMRFTGMPLEKIALYMNSSQVSGKGQLAQAFKLTFAEGALAPYRVVGPSSFVAWFLQYSVMGMAFQTVDHLLSNVLGVQPMYYGAELMQPLVEEKTTSEYKARTVFKTLLSPVLAASLESNVSNRAEVQRYFGPKLFAEVEAKMGLSGVRRAAGPAFLPNVMRNFIMCQTTFVLTPMTYKMYFPQEKKSKTSLFWFGLGMNMFVGNVAAITQQALWGRTLDYAARHGTISYSGIIKEGFAKEGIAAFFTTPKWFSRVLMNAPAQGVLPWFYNEVLPVGEDTVLWGVKSVYKPVSASPAFTKSSPSPTSQNLSTKTAART
jgi:hypothetical protein